MFRICVKEHQIGDYTIKKGTYVRTHPFREYFNPKNFEDPFAFNPERWNSAKSNDLNPYSFLPFWAGPRNCIG